jgi:hypothetical protein
MLHTDQPRPGIYGWFCLRASQLAKYFSAAAASMILLAVIGVPLFLTEAAPLRRLYSSSVSRRFRRVS